jgi:predicted MPP superfamily phosphohydrolase
MRKLKVSRRRFLQASAVAGLGLGFYTWRIEPHWVEVVERRLPVGKLPAHWAGSRIVQLSDLHIGPRVDDKYLQKTFEHVRALSPEIVVYSGDFTSYEVDGLAHAKRMFRYLPIGSAGTFAVLGNHDYGPGWAHPETADSIAELAGAVGIRVLRNEIVETRGLQIVGLDDLWGQRFEPLRAFANLKADQASIVLSHNPDSVDEWGWDSYRGWILSGHTHGGQCKPPFLPAPLLPVKNRRYRAGEYQLDGGRQLYINRGLGHLLRVRFNVRPEITVFHLVG